MLILTRKRSEGILIGKDVRIVVVSVRGPKVKLGIIAPDGVKVVRDEIADRYEEWRDDDSSVDPEP